MKYQLEFTSEFEKKLKELIKRDPQIKKKVNKILHQLIEDPYYPGLKTHKVTTRNHGKKYSSTLTGDLRIIWDFMDNKLIILVITVGGHTGKNKVYQ